jgi:hypothetical protein
MSNYGGGASNQLPTITQVGAINAATQSPTGVPVILAVGSITAGTAVTSTVLSWINPNSTNVLADTYGYMTMYGFTSGTAGIGLSWTDSKASRTSPTFLKATGVEQINAQIYVNIAAGSTLLATLSGTLVATYDVYLSLLQVM